MRRIALSLALTLAFVPLPALAQMGWSPGALSAWVNANPYSGSVILQKQFVAERNGFRGVLVCQYYKDSPPPTFSDNAVVAIQRQVAGGSFTIYSGGKVIFSQPLLEILRYWNYAVMPDVEHLFVANLTAKSQPEFLIVLDDARGPHARDFSVFGFTYSNATRRYREMPGKSFFAYGGSVGFTHYPHVMLVPGSEPKANDDMNAAPVSQTLTHPDSVLARGLLDDLVRPSRVDRLDFSINSAYFTALGDQLTVARKYIEAEQAYRKGLTVMAGQKENDLPARLGLAHLYEVEGHADEALAAYQALFNREILRFDEGFAPYDVLSRIVVLELRRDDVKAALGAYNKAFQVRKLAEQVAYNYQYAHFGHNAAAARAAAKLTQYNALGANVDAGLMSARINYWYALHPTVDPSARAAFEANALRDYRFTLTHLHERFTAGFETPEQADDYAEIGSFFSTHGDAKRGLILLEGAAAIYKILSLPVPPEILDSLAQTYAYQGRAADAEAQFNAAFAEIDRLFRYEASEMGERDRLELSQTADRTFDDFAAFAIGSGAVNRLSGTLLERAAQLKGSIARSESAVQRKAAGSTDPSVARLYTRWQALRGRIAGIRAAARSADAARTIGILEREANDLDRQLTAAVGGADQDTAQWPQIRSSLSSGDVLIQFVRSTHYFALVATPQSTLPMAIDLGDADKFDADFAANYAEYTGKLHHERMGSGPALYSLLWKPIAGVVPASARVFISGDGILERVSLGIVPLPNGDILADDYDLRFINTPLDIMRAAPAAARNDAVLLGDPAFPKDTLPALPGTRDEVQGISTLLSAANWKVQTFLGPEAQTGVVTDAREPRVLHLATHGFFLPAQIATGGSPETDLIANLQDPMTRSGLIFAGGKELTAGEAASLDLQGTELVVLSACESGLGLQGRGEGVFGLRRAFQEAGARAMLVSMWSVPDPQTARLMQLFYKYWIGDGLEKHVALRRAQAGVRKEIIATYGRDLPYYWGAFVLAGP